MTAVAIRPGKIVATETKVAEDASFSAFYDANRDQLVRAVWASIRDRDLAAEAVDEAFTRAYGRWDQLSEAGNIAGWVFRTAVNWSISRFRKLDTRRRLGFKAAQRGEVVDVVRDPDLAKALEKLPLEQRTVLVLRYLLDWDIATTAEALGIKEGTVRSRTTRAIEAMRATTEFGDHS